MRCLWNPQRHFVLANIFPAYAEILANMPGWHEAIDMNMTLSAVSAPATREG